MTDSNRLQFAGVKEVTVGTTPNTPRMRKARLTGESLKYAPEFTNSDEIRDDRMNADPIKIGEKNDGGTNWEMHYPVQDSVLASAFESGMQSTWQNMPVWDNDGTADSVITDAGTTADTYVVTSGGAAAKAGHLVQASGFTNSANNKIFRVASSTGTTVVGSSISLTAETAPPGTARLKVVGFAGASGDITATASGLGSTSLDFTTLGLAAGQWIKIGGTATGDKFATAALNAWVRITAIAATALTCDNLPSGWTTDAGTGKTIKVWTGDWMKNGTTLSALTLERGFMGQAVPTYIAQAGMAVNQIQLQFQAKQKLGGSFSFMGLTGSQGTTSLDASPDAAPSTTTYPVMAASTNVGRVAEAGSAVSGPNWVRSLQITVNNNLRMIDAVGSVSSVAHGSGECAVSVTMETYFGSNALLTKLFAGTATSVNAIATKNGQAFIVTLPRLTNTDGSPNAQGKNQDVVLSLTMQSSIDSLTGAHIMMQRVEYYE